MVLKLTPLLSDMWQDYKEQRGKKSSDWGEGGLCEEKTAAEAEEERL